MLKLGLGLCVLRLISSIQISNQEVVFDMMPNTFDDQYFGCEEEMEEIAPKLLEEEMGYDQFAVMWNLASYNWTNKAVNISDDFKDEYGIALILYTMEVPHPIYRQLNGNLSLAGRSRDHYMEKFHFKALHYYLTRALQVLGGNCSEMTEVYRGTQIGDVNVTELIRFGRFTSTSLVAESAANFGVEPFFNISTCFGVDIDYFSPYDEQEILIPTGEMFNKIDQVGDTYVLESTGELCSFFNCAYLGEEKSNGPICYSDSGGFLMPKIWLLLPTLIFTLNPLFISFL
ncbi:ecto-ADP-ribosyltransferase 5-like isoform X2 [Hyperolius riggenbachi]|uniref:ecto-ADP-ribosyltransferase 5-like isoform X2 n=1 Tax=Hyperolius riggenbachi TaxID=752182 RepID=UPI0035A3B0A3